MYIHLNNFMHQLLLQTEKEAVPPTSASPADNSSAGGPELTPHAQLFQHAPSTLPVSFTLPQPTVPQHTPLYTHVYVYTSV